LTTEKNVTLLNYSPKEVLVFSKSQNDLTKLELIGNQYLLKQTKTSSNLKMI